MDSSSAAAGPAGHTGSLRFPSSNSGNCQSNSAYGGHTIVRLNSIEPNTVMFNTKDYPILNDVTVPEIIDELEKQFEDKLHDLQGVRLVASNVYICLSRKESLQHLTTYGFYVRGVPIKVVDITNESVVVCLTGVPHYITDATITMLVSTFGIAIGELERRFYKGVDTGERFVRLKPRPHTQIPDFVTVGGCKILIRVLNPEEVSQPFTLQSATSSINEPGPIDTISETRSFPPMSSHSLSNGGTNSTNGPKSRAKLGHCNGSLTSPKDTPSILSSFATSAPRTELIATGVTGLLSTPLSGATGTGSNFENVSNASTSPKIGKSLRSRLTGAIIEGRAPADGDVDEVDRHSNSYIPGEALDIPTLSPPPYKAPSSAGSVSSDHQNGPGHHSALPTSSSSHVMNTSNGLDLKALNGGGSSKVSRDSSSGGLFSSSIRKYKHHSSKTESSNNSVTSSLAGKSTEALKDGSNNNNHHGKRSSVVFDEDKHSKSGTLKHRTLASKTVNGILRKGSGPNDDIVATTTTEDKSRKNRKSKDKRKSRSGMGNANTDSDRDIKEDSSRNSRSSKSNSTKTGSQKDKAQKDLALTRDLPWCGCWGNGCL